MSGSLARSGHSDASEASHFEVIWVLGLDLKDLQDEDRAEIAPGLCACARPPVELTEPWNTWLGAGAGDYKRARFFVHSSASSPALAARMAASAWHSLCLMGTPRADRVRRLSGELSEGEVRVHEAGDAYQPVVGHRGCLSRQEFDLEKWKLLCGSLRTIRDEPIRFRRLGSGVHAFLRGVGEVEGAKRLHDFVRATESVIRLGKSDGAPHFARRVSNWVDFGDDRKAAEELYKLRNKEEHHEPLSDVVDVAGDKTRERRLLNIRAEQAEWLARTTLCRVLSSTKLLEHFEGDGEAFHSADASTQAALLDKRCGWRSFEADSDERLGIDSRTER